MKGIIKVSAILLTTAMLAGSVSEVAYARCGHHSRSTSTTSTTEYAACYQDGVCVGDGCCDEYGVCLYGGSCAGHDGYDTSCAGNTRSHHSGRSHRRGVTAETKVTGIRRMALRHRRECVEMLVCQWEYVRWY